MGATCCRHQTGDLASSKSSSNREVHEVAITLPEVIPSKSYEDLPPFDEERLRELDLVVNLRETLHGFVKHGRILLEGLDQAIEEGSNSTEIAKAAHALKGAAKTVGATKLSLCAENIEREAKQGQPCQKYRKPLEAAFEEMAYHVSTRR